MRVVHLSDHPGDLLKSSRERELKQHEAHARRHQAEVRQLERTRDQARAGRRWLTWLRAVLAVRRARRRTQAAPRPGKVVLSDEQAKLTAGIRGEQLVADELGRALGKDWVLFRGYRNKAGEIDHVLLGPRGLMAIEVKTISGAVHCDGDRWWVDRYDRYGNQVGHDELLDRGKRRRSPSMQLNEPADLLEEFLKSRGQDVDLLRVVFLAHERSEIGTLQRATVSVFTKVSEVTGLMRKMPQPLDGPRRERLEELIVRDHRHHDAYRQRARGRS